MLMLPGIFGLLIDIKCGCRVAEVGQLSVSHALVVASSSRAQRCLGVLLRIPHVRLGDLLNYSVQETLVWLLEDGRHLVKLVFLSH